MARARGSRQQGPCYGQSPAKRSKIPQFSPGLQKKVGNGRTTFRSGNSLYFVASRLLISAVLRSPSHVPFVGLLAPLVLAACTAATTQTALCTHNGPPPVVRPDLPTFFETSPGRIVWPPNDGFEPATLRVVIQPGALLDRFGDNAGSFFSPKGTGYRERALPYLCQGYAYATYRVVKPLPALVETAIPWFGEPGGAMQVETTSCVNQLLAAGVLEPVPHSPPPACSS
jgi:Tuberculosis necrotizing toxin